MHLAGDVIRKPPESPELNRERHMADAGWSTSGLRLSLAACAPRSDSEVGDVRASAHANVNCEGPQPLEACRPFWWFRRA